MAKANEVSARNDLSVKITNGSEAIKEMPAPLDPMLMEFQALFEEGEASDDLPEKLTPKQEMPRPPRVKPVTRMEPATQNSRTRKSVSPQPAIQPREPSPSRSTDSQGEASTISEDFSVSKSHVPFYI